MSDEAGKHIGMGLAFMGFWLMIGLANFGEKYIYIEHTTVGTVICDEKQLTDNSEQEGK